MRRKIELIGGYFDGMHTFVELGQQQIILLAPASAEFIKPGDDLYPTEIKPLECKYRSRLKDPRKYDWVKP